MVAYRRKWIDRFEAERDFYVNPAKIDPYQNWAIGRMPEVNIDRCMDPGLELLYAGQYDLGMTFLRKAKEVADRILREGKCQSEPARFGYPHNEAEVLRAKAYLDAIVEGALKSNPLVDSARLFEQFIARADRKDWKDPQTQAHLVAQARLLYASGALSDGQALLKKNLKRLEWHIQQVESLLLLAEAAQKPSEAARAQFDQFFDRIRDPDYKRSPPGALIYEEIPFQRLELATLRDLYLANPRQPLEMERVINAISR